MSSDREIREVFDRDIAEMSRVVLSKSGPAPFYEGFRGMRVESVLPDEFIEVCGAIERADMENE
jgi:hypothetical protein